MSDSKTRASGTVPRESDTLAGRLQVMLYKELLDALLLPSEDQEGGATEEKPDAILPTETPFSWMRLFDHLQLQPDGPFSDSFMVQSKPIVAGNGLRFGVDSASTLKDMVRCWRYYVDALGLGTPLSKSTSVSKATDRGAGRTEDKLELVYRRAGAKSRESRKSKGAKDSDTTRPRNGRRKKRKDPEAEIVDVGIDESESIQKAIEASLLDMPSDTVPQMAGEIGEQSGVDPDTETSLGVHDNLDAEDDELAWAVEMSLGAKVDEVEVGETADIVVRASQASDQAQRSPSVPSTQLDHGPQPSSARSDDDDAETTSPSKSAGTSGSGSGSIIGRSSFTHSPRRLAAHLASVLDWWLGHREAVGVSIEETRRCGWCEFEEGCEWR